MTSNKALCCAVLLALSTSAWGARKPLHKPVKKHSVRTETLTCRDGTENRHARIAVVLVAGKPDSFAYYSKWKPRTCSIYLQRNRDAYSRWVDKGKVTTVSLERGLFLIEHRKNAYRFVFRDIDRERYCGMDGTINGTLTIRKGSEHCQLTGIMEEGVPLGQAFPNVPQSETPAVSATAVGATRPSLAVQRSVRAPQPAQPSSSIVIGD